MAWYFLGLDNLFARRNTAVKPTTQPAKPKPARQTPTTRQQAQPRPTSLLATGQTQVLSRTESDRARQEAQATIPRVLVKKGGADQLTDRGVPLSDPEILKLLGETPTETLERDAVLSAEDPARKKPSDTVFDHAQDTPTTEIEVITPPSSPSKSGIIRAGTVKLKIEKTREDTSEAAAKALDQFFNRKPKSKGK